MCAKPTPSILLLLALLGFNVFTASAQKLYPVTTDVPVITSAGSGMDSTGADVFYDLWQTTFKRLLLHIKDGTTAAYDNNGKVIKLDAIFPQYEAVDTVQSVDPRTLVEETKIVKNYFEIQDLWELLSALRIRQQWHITDSGVITKKVQAFAPLYPMGPKRNTPVYWCRPASQSGLNHSLILSYNVDLKSFGDSSAQSTFLKDLTATLKNGKAKVYEWQSTKRLNATEITAALDKRSVNDTITMIDPVALTETTKVSVSAQKVHIVKIRFTEEWTLDDRGNFSIRVIKYEPKTEIHWQPDNSVTLVPLFAVQCGRE